MSNISSAVLNGVLEGMVVALSEGNLDNLNNLSKAYQRLKSVGVDGEDNDLLHEVLNKMLLTIQKSNPDNLEKLSSSFQRVASFERDRQINNLQEKSV